MQRFGLRIVWAALCLVATSAWSHAAIWNVRPDGTGDYDQMSAACLAAAPGDTVAAWPGDYAEWDGGTPTFIYDKPLTLLGWGGLPEEIRARVNFRFIDCETIVVEGITFHDDVSPIFVAGGDTFLTVRNCRF